MTEKIDNPTVTQRIGVFGGSFDPIHYAHLWLAETASEQLQLDQVWFIPAAQSPLKQEKSPTDSRHRLEMLKLATNSNPKFIVDDRELLRSGVSYTIDTLEDIHAELPFTQIFLILGADSLNDFGRWHRPSEICKLAALAVAHRGGKSPIDWDVLQTIVTPARLAVFAQTTINMPQIDLSSSQIRSRISTGKSIRYFTPAPVAAYITANQLYAKPNH